MLKRVFTRSCEAYYLYVWLIASTASATVFTIETNLDGLQEVPPTHRLHSAPAISPRQFHQYPDVARHRHVPGSASATRPPLHTQRRCAVGANATILFTTHPVSIQFSAQNTASTFQHLRTAGAHPCGSRRRPRRKHLRQHPLQRLPLRRNPRPTLRHPRTRIPSPPLPPLAF